MTVTELIELLSKEDQAAQVNTCEGDQGGLAQYLVVENINGIVVISGYSYPQNDTHNG